MLKFTSKIAISPIFVLVAVKNQNEIKKLEIQLADAALLKMYFYNY